MTHYDVERSHRMHVVHDGAREAPPLLLIHGSGASCGSWGPMVPALADHHHVVRVDLPARPVDIPDDMIAELRGTTYHAFREVSRCNTAYITERSVPERLAALEAGVPCW